MRFLMGVFVVLMVSGCASSTFQSSDSSSQYKNTDTFQPKVKMR